MSRRLPPILPIAVVAAAVSCLNGCSRPPTQDIVGAAAQPTPSVLGRVPLHFEENRGQTDARVQYLTRGPGYTVYLSGGESMLVLARRTGGTGSADASGAHPERRTPEAEVLRTHLVGADPAVQLEALDEVPARAHYLVGSDPRKWRTHVPTFARVRARSAYPGIDVVYYGNSEQLEHDFIVSPGADPGRIRVAFEGQSERVHVDDQGNLIVPMRGGQVVQKAPVIYQERDGRRERIAGRYVLHGADPAAGGRQEIGFAIAAYDASRPLVVDPILAYSTYFGGSDTDGGFIAGIAVDATGSAYVTGGTASLDFPTAGALQGAPAAYDAFVSKFTPDGSALVYSTYLGGNGTDIGIAIAVDASGSAHIFGLTSGAGDFPTEMAFQPSYAGGQDNFVAKLTSAGDALVYSSFLGGSGFEGNSGGIALDAVGSAYVAGFTASPDFPTQAPLQAALAGDYDAYVAKLSPAGSSLVYSTYLGGATAPVFDEVTYGIAVDASGSAYVAGMTGSADFPTVTPAQASCPAMSCAFLSKLTPAGSALAYSTYLGGTTGSNAYAVAVDRAGRAYLTGVTEDDDFPTALALQPARGGGQDAFVARFAPDGQQLEYSTYLGGSGPDRGLGIAVANTGSAFVAGVTDSPDFPTSDAVQPTHGGSSDAFVTHLGSSGGGLLYSTFLGGAGMDAAIEIAPRPSAGLGSSFIAAYVVGVTASSDFPTEHPYQGALSGPDDVFVTKVADGAVQTQQAVLAGGTVNHVNNLIDVSVTSPNAGSVTIVGGVHLGAPGGQIEFDITAPPATAANPLVLRFLAHPPNASALVTLVRNLDRVVPCTGAAGTASPDPCIASTTPQPGGDLEIVVHTSTASLWTFFDHAASPACPATPATGCQPAQATKGQLHLVSKPDDGKDKLTWKWTSSGAVTVSDFGSPSTSSAYQLCTYTQDALRLEAIMPAGALCAGRPCWRATPVGHLYSDKEGTPSGIAKMTLRAGAAGKAKVIVTGKGTNLADTTFPLALPVKVQLTRLDDGRCWETTFSNVTVSKPDQFKAKSD